MASKSLFTSPRYKAAAKPAAATTVNDAGGTAYATDPRHALAQYALTGTIGGTFYVSAETELQRLLDLAQAVGDPEYVAQTAVYAHERGFMKDAPVVLLLSLISPKAVAYENEQKARVCFDLAFPRVVTNGRQVRNVVQIMRSGTLGRKSLGTQAKRAIKDWLVNATDWQLWNASVGESPSLRDVIRMTRPHPFTFRSIAAGDSFGSADYGPQREAFFGYLAHSKRDRNDGLLPADVRAFEAYTAMPPEDRLNVTLPNAPFELLLGLPNLTADDWKAIARHATWQQTRANLNTFARHGVFDDAAMVELVARKLRDPEQIARAKVLPYQLLAATVMTATLPQPIRDALRDAVMLACQNVPTFGDRGLVIGVDCSGSMNAPVTGQRGSATTAVQCRDAAALVTYALLQRNPSAVVLPFSDRVYPKPITAGQSLDELTRILHSVTGGTAVSAPLAFINAHSGAERPDVVVLISDNESWMDSRQLTMYEQAEDAARSFGRVFTRGASHTETLRQWDMLRHRNPNARLVCVDLAPNSNTQAFEREDILNIGGFSDQVWEITSRWITGETDQRLVDAVEAVRLG